MESANNFEKYTDCKESDYLPRPRKGFATTAIHAGQPPDSVHGSVNVPIHLSTTYAQKSPGVPYSQYDYTRCGNPTRDALEQCLSAVECGKKAITFSSGCGAMSAIMHCLKTGDHIVCCDDVYGGTQRYMRRIAEPNFGFQLSFVDMTNLANIEPVLKDNTRLVWIETPTNPTMKVCDIEEICKIVKAKLGDKVWIVTDNTFASPYLQTPMKLGSDIVVNSISKYIAGHSDVIMGCLIFNNDEIHKQLEFAAKTQGSCPGIFDCYQALKGLKTLEARMRIHCYNAWCLNKYLEDSPYVEKLFYPGSTKHANHEIAKKQMHGYGGMIAFVIKGGMEASVTFLSNLHIFTLAESLGGVESLAEHPASMTHGSVPPEVRKELGIDDGFIRLSVGIEGIQDILEDVDRAFKLTKK